MKLLIKISIVLILFEILSGYLFYLKDGRNLTGNYISSSLRIIERLLSNQKADAKDITTISCKEELEYNRSVNIANMVFQRQSMRIQTNLDFLNSSDLTNKYIIFIVGNSETLGAHQDKQKRIHTKLEDKLQNEFNSNNIKVINLSERGYFINDQLNAVKYLSSIYDPDLVIFYTGGNEIYLENYYEDMLKQKGDFFGSQYYMNIENDHWYSFWKENQENKDIQNCLDEKVFLKQSNFPGHKSLDINQYIKKGFNRVNTYLDDRATDFIFYIHPFSDENTQKIKNEKNKINILKLKDISILDNDFINLSTENYNLDWHETYHTRDATFMSNILFQDILKKYEQKIYKKINID